MAVELQNHPACQSKYLGFETKVVRQQGQPHGTVRSVGPIREGPGYRWLVSPNGFESYLWRTGLDHLGSNKCTLCS